MNKTIIIEIVSIYHAGLQETHYQLRIDGVTARGIFHDLGMIEAEADRALANCIKDGQDAKIVRVQG